MTPPARLDAARRLVARAIRERRPAGEVEQLRARVLEARFDLAIWARTAPVWETQRLLDAAEAVR